MALLYDKPVATPAPAPQPTGPVTLNLPPSATPQTTTPSVVPVATAKMATDNLAQIKNTHATVTDAMTKQATTVPPATSDYTASATKAGVQPTDVAAEMAKYPGLTSDAAIGNLLMRQQRATTPPPDITAQNIQDKINEATGNTGGTQTTQTPNANSGIDDALRSGLSDPAAIANFINDNNPGGTAVNVNDVRNYINGSESASYLLKTNVNQQKIDAEHDQYRQDIDNLRNGTIPLTSGQQSQLTALQQQFDQLKEQQKLANKNYEGAITQAGIVSGRQRYAPEIQAGEFQAAVSAGIQKLAAIDAQAAKAVADMTEGFQTKNFDLITKAHADFLDTVKAKTDTIDKLHQEAVKATEAAKKEAQDARDFAYKQTQDYIKTILDNDRLTLDEQKAKVSEEMDRANLTLDQRRQIEVERHNKESERLDAQAKDPYSGGGLGVTPVTVNAIGQPNPIDQATFLKALPLETQTIVKGLTSYTANPANISLKGNEREKMLALAHQYDPTFDESQFTARATFNKNWASGDLMANRVAVNTGINHLSELNAAANALKNKQFTGALGIWTKKYNTIAQMVADNSGDPAIKAYDSIVSKVAAELAKAYKGGKAAPTEDEIKAERETLERGLSPAQIDAVIGRSVALLGGRTVPLAEEYRNTMGKEPDPIIGDSARNSIMRMRANGVPIDTETLDPGNTWRYQTLPEYYQENRNQQTTLDKIINANPGISDWDAIQAAHAFGEDSSGFNQPLSMGENGSTVLGSRLAQVNNNPGNLRFVGQAGATQGEGGFAKFSSPAAGFKALQDQIALDAGRGHTLKSFVNKFAPPSENDTGLYVKQMAQAMGVNPDTKLSALDINKLAKAMALKESSSRIA